MTELLPKGSASYDKMAIAQALENMGIPGGLDFSIDNFRISFGTHLVAADLKEYCRLLSDILRNPSFAEDELSKTKVEWQARFQEAMNNTKMLAWNKLRQIIYPAGHPYYEKPFAEELKELPLVTRDNIVALHKESFSPGSAIISLVGDIDLDHAASIFENCLGDWRGQPPLAIDVPKAPLPLRTERFDIEVADKQSADIVIGHPSTLRRTNADFYAAKLANAVLGQDTITSRLGQIVREKAGLTYGIYSSFSDTAYGEAPWAVSLSVNPHNVGQALGLVSRVLDDYQRKGINEQELKKETGRAVGSFKVGLASSLGIAKALSEFEFLGLGAAALDKITDQYLSVTKKAANEAVQKYMSPDRAVTVVAGTLSKK
jgi:zinc protease